MLTVDEFVLSVLGDFVKEALAGELFVMNELLKFAEKPGQEVGD